MESCGLTAADFQGMGTVTNINVFCTRDRDALIMEGRYTLGTLNSDQVRINLKFQGKTLTISNAPITRSLGYFFENAAVTSDGGAVLGNTGETYIKFSRHQVFGPASGDPLVATIGTSFGISNMPVSFFARIPIAEWSSQTNAAIVACKEGPLKCNNTLYAYMDNTTTVTQPYNFITSCVATSTGVKTCQINSAIGLTEKLDCAAIPLNVGATGSTAPSYDKANSSLTQIVFRNQSPTGPYNNFTDFKASCTKTINDSKNPNETVTPMSDMNDVKSTEWVVGYDYISNKPIYKRCHYVSTNITTNTTLTTWPTNLNPKDIFSWGSGNYVIQSSYVSSGYGALVFYNKSSGSVSFEKNGSALLEAGSTLCMKYTR